MGEGLGHALFGAIAGWAWWCVTIAACGALSITLRDAGKDKLIVLLASVFTPCPYCLALAVYGIYMIFSGSMNFWFLGGFITPIVPVLLHRNK